MPSTPSKPRSIATQLVVYFTLAAALILSGTLAALYVIVIQHSSEEDNEGLADRVAATRADLKNGGPKILQDQLQLPGSRERTVYWIRVLDAAGHTYTETQGMEAILPARLFPPPFNFQEDFAPKTYREHGKLFSLVSSAEKAGGEVFVLQVAQDRSADKEYTWNFALLLVGMLALGVFCSAIIATKVTRRGLRPLDELTRSLERVGPKRLHERVPAAGWPTELQPLVVAFDEMLDRLEDSFSRLSQFSADLAHELRTPIANLRGEAEVALSRSRTGDEYREVVESSVVECERLSRMIDNLLFLARAESADKAIQRETLDGRAAVEKIAAYYETIAEARGIRIECFGEGQVYAEPVLFSRAVSNLVENALRFTSEKGSIAIAFRVTSIGTEVSVQDDGSGISAEHLPRVFDRFYRVDSSRSAHGTGLGLAMVKSIAALHGGTVTIASTPGKGTVVKLSLPNET